MFHKLDYKDDMSTPTSIRTEGKPKIVKIMKNPLFVQQINS